MYKGRDVKAGSYHFLSLESLESFLNSSEVHILEVLRFEKNVDGYRIFYVYEDLV